MIAYYYPQVYAERNQHSYPYLFKFYTEYPKRACENLGISSEKKENEVDEFNTIREDEEIIMLDDSEYPEELKELLKD